MKQNVKSKKQKGGGSVMVWGMITSDGVGPIVRVDGNINTANYISILTNHLLPFLHQKREAGQNPIFQQDNARPHTAAVTTKFFIRNEIPVLPWPASSPDMNIIEHVWAILKSNVKARVIHPKNMDELWEAIQEEWYAIPLQQIQNLYSSLPCWLEALHKAKGGFTPF